MRDYKFWNNKLNEIRSRYETLQSQFEMIEALRFLDGRGPLRNFIEIGSHWGGSFACWAQVVEGKKISVDIPYDMVKDNFEDRNRKWAEDFDDVHVCVANSHDPRTVAAVEQCLDGEKVDLLFIDGDHTYEGVKADYEMYKHLVSDTGIIAFHDISDSEQHHRENCYVDRLWYEVPCFKVAFTAPYERLGIGFFVKGHYDEPQDIAHWRLPEWAPNI